MPTCTCHLIDYPAVPPWDKCRSCNDRLDLMDAQLATQRQIQSIAESLGLLADAIVDSPPPPRPRQSSSPPQRSNHTVGV